MSDAPTPHAPVTARPAARGPGYETRDIRVRPILYTAAGIGVAIVLTQVAMWLLFDLLAAREAQRAVSDRPLAHELRRELPPEPRLQRAPVEDLAALRAWEDRMLTTYAVIDRGAGVVRIPIERAMDLVVERGLPVRKSEGGHATQTPQADVRAEPPTEGAR